MELRLISTNHGALSPNGNDNDDAKNNNIISLSKTLYQQKTTKNCQNFLGKGLKDQCIGTNIKQILKIKTRQMSIDIFST